MAFSGLGSLPSRCQSGGLNSGEVRFGSPPEPSHRCHLSVTFELSLVAYTSSHNAQKEEAEAQGSQS